MLILLVIIFAIFLYFYTRVDKRDDAAVLEQQKNMPRFEIHSPEMGSVRRLFIEKSHSIQTFIYDNQKLFIEMRNGKVAYGNINDAFVEFDKFKTLVTATVKLNGTKVTIQEYTEQFDTKTWRSIYGILILAGKTRRKSLVAKRFSSIFNSF